MATSTRLKSVHHVSTTSVLESAPLQKKSVVLEVRGEAIQKENEEENQGKGTTKGRRKHGFFVFLFFFTTSLPFLKNSFLFLSFLIFLIKYLLSFEDGFNCGRGGNQRRIRSEQMGRRPHFVARS